MVRIDFFCFQVLKASRAMLVAHQRSASSSKKQKLIDSPGENMLVAQFALRKIPQGISAKPIRIKVWDVVVLIWGCNGLTATKSFLP